MRGPSFFLKFQILFEVLSHKWEPLLYISNVTCFNRKIATSRKPLVPLFCSSVVGNQSSFVLLSGVVETLDILWMSSEDRSGLENVECKTN